MMTAVWNTQKYTITVMLYAYIVYIQKGPIHPYMVYKIFLCMQWWNFLHKVVVLFNFI